jgi:hypothetical protein
MTKKIINNSDINNQTIISKNILTPLWFSVSESAKICGITTKTIRRALEKHNLRYKIAKNRYLVDFASLIIYVYSKKKLKNKLNQYGIGQYVDKWYE